LHLIAGCPVKKGLLVNTHRSHFQKFCGDYLLKFILCRFSDPGDAPLHRFRSDPPIDMGIDPSANALRDDEGGRTMAVLRIYVH
jgi:hypothetical protein